MQKKTEAYIHVKARLWNSTLVSDYPRVDRVDIVSYAQIKLPDAYGIVQRKDDDRVSVSTQIKLSVLSYHINFEYRNRQFIKQFLIVLQNNKNSG